MAEGLALKLEILKGPRKGETLEYRPGSKIRIGRVVRGNNLPIKDSGISTNHLLITSSDSVPAQWLLTDLHSSNGTILNDAALAPDTPAELRNGDEIKIGEQTSIKVKVDEEENRLRRNPRRAAAPATARGRRGRAAKVESEEVRSAVEEVANPEEVEVVEKPKRRGRPPRNDTGLKTVEEKEKEEEVVVAVEVSKRPVRSKNAVADSESRDLEREEVRVEPRRRARTRKNAQKSGNAAVSVGVSRVIVDKGEVSEQKQFGETSKVSNFGDMSGDAKGKAKESNSKEADYKVESGSVADNVDKKGSGSGVKESLGKNWQEEPDLEKMTLDGWFDYVEFTWPKVVNAEVDKICAGMRERARLVNEHIAQHKKEMGSSSRKK